MLLSFLLDYNSLGNRSCFCTAFQLPAWDITSSNIQWRAAEIHVDFNIKIEWIFMPWPALFAQATGLVNLDEWRRLTEVLSFFFFIFLGFRVGHKLGSIKRYSKSLLQYYGDIIIAIIMGISWLQLISDSLCVPSGGERPCVKNPILCLSSKISFKKNN